MAFRVVLVEPTHPGNIGAVARAMGNMGVTRLELVQPADHLSHEALTRSAGNETILRRAGIHTVLDEAIADCSLVIGTSARLRTIKWPSLSPNEAAREAVAAARRGERVALVFGQERAGLANEHLDRCSMFVRIPVSDTSPSINLAGAALIMLYELRQAAAAGTRPEPPEHSSEAAIPAGQRPAQSAQLEGFFDQLEQVLHLTGFISGGPRHSLLRKIRRIFVRSGMTQDEVNIMRGILSSVEYQHSKGWKSAADNPDRAP